MSSVAHSSTRAARAEGGAPTQLHQRITWSVTAAEAQPYNSCSAKNQWARDSECTGLENETSIHYGDIVHEARSVLLDLKGISYISTEEPIGEIECAELIMRL